MDSVQFIKTLRYLFANDATLRGYLGASTVNEALQVLIYSDGVFSQISDFFRYPMVSFRLDDEESTLRGSDSNSPLLNITVHNPSARNSCITTNNRIKDRVKLLIRDNNEAINNQAASLGLILKVRDANWVGAVTYEDKELGSERLHKIICTCNFIVGD